MATITETRVRVRIEATLDDAGQPVVVAVANSFAADGRAVRSLRRNITEHLSASRLTGTAALLADVETWVKAQWEIP